MLINSKPPVLLQSIRIWYAVAGLCGAGPCTGGQVVDSAFSLNLGERWLVVFYRLVKIYRLVLSANAHMKRVRTATFGQTHRAAPVERTSGQLYCDGSHALWVSMA